MIEVGSGVWAGMLVGSGLWIGMLVVVGVEDVVWLEVLVGSLAGFEVAYGV